MIKSHRLLGAISFVLVISVTTAWSWYLCQSSFLEFDDEGYFLISNRAFELGQRLYQDFFSQYGPTYFFYNSAWSRLFDLPWSHETIRWHFLIIVAVTGGVWGFTLLRKQQSVLVALLSLLLVQQQLVSFGALPGHPQELISLLVILLLSASALAPAPWREIFLGVLCGLLMGVKFNIGLFALIAVLFHPVLTWTRAPRVFRLLFICISASLPFVILREQIPQHIFFAVTLALPLLLYGLNILQHHNTARSGAKVLALIVGFLFAIVITVAISAHRGVSPSMLLWGTVLQHTHFPTTFSFIPDSQHSMVLSIPPLVSTALFAVVYLRPKFLQPYPFVAVQALTVLLVGLLLADRVLLAESLGFSFLWLLARNPRLGSSSWLYSVAFPLSLLLSFSSVPVTSTHVPLLCLAAIAPLVLATAFPPQLRAPAVAVLLSVAAFTITGDLLDKREQYLKSTPLALPGTGAMRLEKQRVDALRQTAAALESRGSTFLSIPGLNSFYFWTQLEPPSWLNVTTPALLSPSQQQSVLNSFEDKGGQTLLTNRDMLRFWLHNDQKATPFMRLLRQDFVAHHQFGPYEILAMAQQPQVTEQRLPDAPSGLGR